MYVPFAPTKISSIVARRVALAGAAAGDDSVPLSVPSRERTPKAEQLTVPANASTAASTESARPVTGKDWQFGMRLQEGEELAEEGRTWSKMRLGSALSTVLPAFASKVQTNNGGEEQPCCNVARSTP